MNWIDPIQTTDQCRVILNTAMNSEDCLEQLSACYLLKKILLHHGYRASLIQTEVSKGPGRQLKGLNRDLKVSRNGSIYWALWFL